MKQILSVSENKVHVFRLLLFALACTVLYHFLMERQASVLVEVHTTAPTSFKMYWLNHAAEQWSEQKSRRINLQPYKSFYTFKLTNLARVAVLRIDPSEAMAQVTIRSVSITQNGYLPIQIKGKDDYSRIKLGEGIESIRISDEGLMITPSGGDPQLFFDLPGSLYKTAALWNGELVPLTAIFLFVFCAGLAIARFRAEPDGIIPLMLAVVLVLIVTMAAVSSFNAHPDEEVHVRAGDYFQEHIIPPPVGAEVAKDTYSVYGVSRLNSGEIAYLCLGKFVKIFHALAEPTFMTQRLFNICLWAVLLMLAFAYKDFRLIMAPTLLTPQIWYLFSYVNSDAFAGFVMLLSAYQLASPQSAWNRLLEERGEARANWLTFLCLGFLFGLLLLLKKNFYFFLAFIGGYFLWRLLFRRTRLTRTNVRRIVVVLLIGMGIFAGVRGTDEYINDFNKGEKLLQAREQYAKSLWNPKTPVEKRHAHLQMRERGTDLHRFLYVDKWAAKSFQTSVGMYGFTSVSAPLAYYNLVQYAGLLLLIALSATVLLHGGLEGVCLWLLTIAGAAGLIGVALYIAWTVDFQAQGRYFFPIVGMFSIFFLHAHSYIARSLVPLIGAGLFLLSVYSFIFVGLAGIPKLM